MRIHWGFLVLVLTAASTAVAQGDARPIAPKFYAFCVGMGTPGVKPLALAEQAEMLRELGYDGIGLGLDAHLESNLKTLDKAGLQLYLLWSMVNVAPAETAGNPALNAAIAQLKGRPTTVSVLLTGMSTRSQRNHDNLVGSETFLERVRRRRAGQQVQIDPHIARSDLSRIQPPALAPSQKPPRGPDVGCSFWILPNRNSSQAN